METPNPHTHEWRCYKDNILECATPGCATVARISDLLDKVERRGVEIGRYQICSNLLKPTAMLTVRGRKAVRAIIEHHPLTRHNSIHHRQIGLVQ